MSEVQKETDKATEKQKKLDEEALEALKTLVGEEVMKFLKQYGGRIIRPLAEGYPGTVNVGQDISMNPIPGDDMNIPPGSYEFRGIVSKGSMDQIQLLLYALGQPDPFMGQPNPFDFSSAVTYSTDNQQWFATTTLAAGVEYAVYAQITPAGGGTVTAKVKNFFATASALPPPPPPGG